ncbi:MAG: pyrroline-5-carboxylate reductase [Fusobacteriaceae bacterium]
MNILFVGIGNMGGSILKSLLKSKNENIQKNSYYVAKKSQKTYDNMKENGPIMPFDSLVKENMDIIFIGVKPYQIEEAISEHLKNANTSQLFVSMAAGVTIEKLEKLLGNDKKIIRIMPNIPILVGEGMTSITPNKNIEPEDIKKIEFLLSESSKCSILPENKIDAFIGMAGSSPAFGYIFLEAMSDAGVKYGLTREESYYFASQALIGAGKMVLENKTNPGILKDAVCSPGGTTIVGVCTLEEEGFRNSVIKAVSKTIEKSIELSKK